MLWIAIHTLGVKAPVKFKWYSPSFKIKNLVFLSNEDCPILLSTFFSYEVGSRVRSPSCFSWFRRWTPQHSSRMSNFNIFKSGWAKENGSHKRTSLSSVDFKGLQIHRLQISSNPPLKLYIRGLSSHFKSSRKKWEKTFRDSYCEKNLVMKRST